MKTLDEVQTMLNERVNHLLAQHGGRVDVIKIEPYPNTDSFRAAFVKMSGGCQGCAGAKATMRSIVTNCIQDFDNSILSVIDVTDHKDNTNAFFKE